MTWILVVFFTGSTGPVMVEDDYTSQAQCAAAALTFDTPTYTNKMVRTGVAVYCVPEGG